MAPDDHCEAYSDGDIVQVEGLSSKVSNKTGVSKLHSGTLN